MSFRITKTFQAMVQPAAPTPSETLDLSTIDCLPGLNAKVRTFHVFSSAHNPAKVIKDALSRALVHYYPLAGRLVRSLKGELQVECNSQGAWFVEATADCTLEDINNLSHPLVPSYEQLLPDPRPEVDPSDVLVLIQVTQFACNGFVIGLESSHAVFDGLGSAQFLNCIAEFARGLERPTIEPKWHRHTIPKPPSSLSHITFDSLPPLPSYRLEQAIIDVPLDEITSFKTQFLEQTGKTCSAFDVLAAQIWQCRTKSIRLNPDERAKLVFFANARPFINPALPQGFYGNCFFPVTVEVSCNTLVSASRVEAVMMVKEAKAKVRVEFERWAKGEGHDPYVPSLGYSTLFISEWSRLGFNEVDYGWGRPMQVVPLTYSDLIPVCILGSVSGLKGSRLIAQCVEQHHLEEFRDLMKKYN